MRSQKLENESDLHIAIYSDVTHGNLLNEGSQGSYVIFLCGRNRICSPLNWRSQSKHIRRIACSFLAAETLTLSMPLMMPFISGSCFQK